MLYFQKLGTCVSISYSQWAPAVLTAIAVVPVHHMTELFIEKDYVRRVAEARACGPCVLN